MRNTCFKRVVVCKLLEEDAKGAHRGACPIIHRERSEKSTGQGTVEL